MPLNLEQSTEAIRPLQGLHVVELGASPAIGFAGRLLSELGATVTISAKAGQYGAGAPIEGPLDPTFQFLADGKLVGNPDDGGAGDMTRANIILHEDVGFAPPGGVGSWPHPDAGRVIASCTPYGSFGRKRDWKGTELTLFHGGGEGYLMPTGLGQEENPDGPPLRIANHFGYYQAGTTLALAALAALRRSRLRGQTEWVAVSIQEAQLSLNVTAISRYVDGTLETRLNRAFRYGGVLPCLDGYVELLTIEQKQWERLCTALGSPKWAEDPRIRDPMERAKRGTEINAHLRAWSRARSVNEVVAELRAADVPCGPFLTPEELPALPQLVHRHFFREGQKTRYMPGSPWIFRRPASLEPKGDGRKPRFGNSASPTDERPLAGLRAVDFSSHAAGPFAGLMLALLGCEVIRIESSAHLDINRRSHPVYGRLTVPNFDHLAGPKQSLTLNLKKANGVRLAKELISESDVVLENFRPGVMARLGLDWDELSKQSPGLVMLSLSAYGQTGPDSRLAGYAPIFAAEGGLGYMTGYRDGAPCELRNNLDHTSGLMAALSVVALLDSKARTGKGGYADVSAREVAAMMVGEAIVAGQAGLPSRRLGNDHERWAPHGVFPALGDDRWIAIAVRTDDEWRKLADLIGNPELLDPRFFSQQGRREHRTLLERQIGAWTSRHDAFALADLIQKHGVPAEVSMSARDLTEDQHLRERGAFAPLQHPEYGQRITVEAPWRIEGLDRSYTQWSQAMGAQNEQIICGLLGHSRSELEQWIGEQSVY